MNYEKSKAEVQEHFPIVWEFSDESDESFNRVGAGGCGGGSHKKFKARTDVLSIIWAGGVGWPAVLIVSSDVNVRFRRQTKADLAKLLDDFISTMAESLGKSS